MATIEKIKGGYKLLKSAFYACNGYEYFCNERGDWFEDAAMTERLDLDPVDTVDDTDQAMVERFKRDNTLNFYYDAGCSEHLMVEFMDVLRGLKAAPGDALFAGRDGKISRVATGDNVQFAVMPEREKLDPVGIWDAYCDAVLDLSR